MKRLIAIGMLVGTSLAACERAAPHHEPHQPMMPPGMPPMPHGPDGGMNPSDAGFDDASADGATTGSAR